MQPAICIFDTILMCLPGKPLMWHIAGALGPMNKLYQISIRSRSGQSRSDWPFDMCSVLLLLVCSRSLYYREDPCCIEKFRVRLSRNRSLIRFGDSLRSETRAMDVCTFRRVAINKECSEVCFYSWQRGFFQTILTTTSKKFCKKPDNLTLWSSFAQ